MIGYRNQTSRNKKNARMFKSVTAFGRYFAIPFVCRMFFFIYACVISLLWIFSYPQYVDSQSSQNKSCRQVPGLPDNLESILMRPSFSVGLCVWFLMTFPSCSWVQAAESSHSACSNRHDNKTSSEVLYEREIDKFSIGKLFKKLLHLIARASLKEFAKEKLIYELSKHDDSYYDMWYIRQRMVQK